MQDAFIFRNLYLSISRFHSCKKRMIEPLSQSEGPSSLRSLYKNGKEVHQGGPLSAKTTLRSARRPRMHLSCSPRLC